MNLLKVGVIGTGVMGENHVRVYSNLTNQCQLIGVYDQNIDRAHKIAEKYNTKSYKKLEDLLQKVDAVTIAVPTSFHYDVALLCIRHKVHMLIEKPITDNTKEGELLLSKAHKAGVIIQVGHIELFNPTIQVLKKILKNEDVIAIDIHRLSPMSNRILKENVVQDLMIHDLYILYELLDDEIQDFQAFGKTYEGFIRHAMMIAKFKKGVISQVTASFKTEDKVRTIRITTEKAFIQADLISRTILISRSTNYYLNHIGTNYKQQNVIERVMVPPKEPLNSQLSHFIKTIKKNATPKVTGEDGLKFLKITEQISNKIFEHDQIE